MTQDVQPLTWQKRTNIEEHMQFFTKINEIIDNLAPTVDEAEAAIASANDAIATANAASAAASAAASQAQTAASTVAGYDTRLTAVEGEADISADNITALQNVQGDYVKKAGAAQTVTSQIMVPTTATGVRDTQIANGTRIQNDLDAYAPMVRTTGNQTKAGVLTLSTPQAIVASTSSNFNNILLESSTHYNRIISRVRSVDGNLHDQNFDLGTFYAATGINNVALRAFAPRAVLGDTSENQATLSVSIRVENNDTGYVVLTFTKKDGTHKVMRIGTFDGTNWS